MQTKEILGSGRLWGIKAIEKKITHTISCFNSATDFFVSYKCKFCPSFEGMMLKLKYTPSAWQCYSRSVPHTTWETASLSELAVWILTWGCEKEWRNTSAFLQSPHMSKGDREDVISPPIPQWLFLPPSCSVLCTYRQVPSGLSRLKAIFP